VHLLGTCQRRTAELKRLLAKNAMECISFLKTIIIPKCQKISQLNMTYHFRELRVTAESAGALHDEANVVSTETGNYFGV